MASFGALPAELVGHIAAIVNEQDLAWSKVDVPRATPGLDENVPLGRWSPHYGHGIRVLVRVDRRTRRAAVPFLYKSITARAATAPYFRVEVLGYELGQLVHELECEPVEPEQVVSLAAALEGLPNLSSIILSGDSLDILQQGGVGPEQEALVEAMKRALGRITSLEIGQAQPASAARALSHVDKLRLRRFVASDVTSIMPLEDTLVAVLDSLEGLVDVKLDASYSRYNPYLQRRLLFPHVRTLTLRRCGGDFLGYSQGLVFAHHIAPSLEVLAFDDMHFDNYPYPLGELPHPLLPNLRVLRIDFDGPPSFGSFRLDHLPALEHLHVINISDYGDFFPDEASLSTFPPSLRAITVDHAPSVPSSPSASLLAKCDELGIRIFPRWHPAPLDLVRLRIEDYDAMGGYALGALAEDEAVELERLFGWAGARARWLLQVGDGRALQQLAAAALRLRECLAIEQL